MKVKKKITKKKLKQPDEFIGFTERTFHFFNKHMKKVALATLFFVVLFLAIFLFRMWDQKKEDEANQKFAFALELYQRVSSPHQEGSPVEYQNALDGFEELVRKYPKTSSGRISLIYKGSIHLRRSEFDEAIKAYESFLQRGGKEKLFRLLALEGLGYALQGKKDYENALKAFQEIVKLGESYHWAGAHLNIAICYEKIGKKEEALENYRAFLKVSPNSASTHSVLRRISILEK